MPPTERDGCWKSPDGNENCVSLWSGASHKDATVCPVRDRAYEVYAKSVRFLSETRVVPRYKFVPYGKIRRGFLYLYIIQKGLNFYEKSC